MTSFRRFSKHGDPPAEVEGSEEPGPQGPAPGPPPPERASVDRASEVRESIASAARSIDEIIANAQRSAEEIRADATVETDRYVAARRAEADRITAALRARVTLVFANLRRDLGAIERDALAQLDASDTGGLDADVEAASPASGINRSRLEPVPERVPERGGGSRLATAAVIRASQLAVMGQDRAKIEATLRSELGIEDPSEIVDEILPPS